MGLMTSMLKIQMILVVIIDHTIGIIHPSCFWRKMNLGAVLFLVRFLSVGIICENAEHYCDKNECLYVHVVSDVYKSNLKEITF